MPDFQFYSSTGQTNNDKNQLNVYSGYGTPTTTIIILPATVYTSNLAPTTVSVPITASVTGTNSPGGTVTIQQLSGSTWTTAGSITLSAGTGSTTISISASQTLRAYYNGDLNNASSYSTSQSVKVYGPKTFVYTSGAPTYLQTAQNCTYSYSSSNYDPIQIQGKSSANSTTGVQGYSSANGIQATAFCWDTSTNAIPFPFLDLTASVTKVELYMSPTWANSTGGTLQIGLFPGYYYLPTLNNSLTWMYGSTAAPNAGGNAPWVAWTYSWTTKTGGKWLDISQMSDTMLGSSNTTGGSPVGTNTPWVYGLFNGLTVFYNSSDASRYCTFPKSSIQIRFTYNKNTYY